MADILIRKVSARTEQILRCRAERRGVSLESDLRETLERLAREESASPDDLEPFGTWLVSVSRPGADLDKMIDRVRGAPVLPRLIE